jgi:hypothetical protein
MRPFAFGARRRPPVVNATLPTATATGSAHAFSASVVGGSGILQPGVRYWGACGHRDQGGIYTSRSIAQQAADLKDIFGSTPDTVIYRAVGDQQAHADIGTDVAAFQAEGIIPLVLVCTYPGWSGYANEAAAYADCYSETASVIANAPTAQLYEIGNEWNLQVSQPGGNDGESPSDWTGLSFYPLFRGALAGALQALRDDAPDAQVICAANSGWIKIGWVPAILDDLDSIYGLQADFTCLHWYNGEVVNALGLPDNMNNPGGANAYSLMYPSTATPTPIFFSELGASVSGSSEATAATRIDELMDNIYAQGVSASGGELGTIGATLFELYPHGVFATEYYLRDTSGVIEPQGTAVKNWIAAH